MILIIDAYDVPAEKIISKIYSHEHFHCINEINDSLKPQNTFNKLHEIQSQHAKNFIAGSECFDADFLEKIKYYFNEICVVDGKLLKITNKRKRTFHIYSIIRNEHEIVDFVLIQDNFGQNQLDNNRITTSQPYLSVQDEEVVLFPSDED